MAHKPVLPDGRCHHFFTAAGKYTAELCRRPVNAGFGAGLRKKCPYIYSLSNGIFAVGKNSGI
jgi:hypothetical protein